MKRSELLQDYCQLCGKEIGSPDCCKNTTSVVILDNNHAFHHGVDCNGNAGVFEDFEQSIGE